MQASVASRESRGKTQYFLILGQSVKFGPIQVQGKASRREICNRKHAIILRQNGRIIECDKFLLPRPEKLESPNDVLTALPDPPPSEISSTSSEPRMSICHGGAMMAPLMLCFSGCWPKKSQQMSPCCAWRPRLKKRKHGYKSQAGPSWDASYPCTHDEGESWMHTKFCTRAVQLHASLCLDEYRHAMHTACSVKSIDACILRIVYSSIFACRGIRSCGNPPCAHVFSCIYLYLRRSSLFSPRSVLLWLQQSKNLLTSPTPTSTPPSTSSTTPSTKARLNHTTRASSCS